MLLIGMIFFLLEVVQSSPAPFSPIIIHRQQRRIISSWATSRPFSSGYQLESNISSSNKSNFRVEVLYHADIVSIQQKFWELVLGTSIVTTKMLVGKIIQGAMTPYNSVTSSNTMSRGKLAKSLRYVKITSVFTYWRSHRTPAMSRRILRAVI